MENTFLEYRFYDIKVVSYFKNDDSGLDLTGKDLSTSIVFDLNIDKTKGIISLPIKIEYFYMSGAKHIKLFGIETLHSFEIRDFKKLFKDDLLFPKEVLINFVNLAYSGTRGMMVVIFDDSRYKKLFLPIIDPIVVTDDLISAQQK